MRHRRRAVIALAALLTALAAVVSACGQGTQQPAALAPPDSAAYGELKIDLEGEQQQNWQAILRRFPEIGDPNRRIGELVGRVSRDSEVKIDYAKDVQPWLGERIGGFFGVSKDKEVAGALLIATTDEGKAQAFIDKSFDKGGVKRSYEGEDYLFEDRTAAGIVGDYVVIGTEPGFKAAVDAQGGEALADAERFTQRIEKLPDERVAEFFLDYGRLFDVIGVTGGQAANTQALKRLLGPAADAPVTLSAVLENDGLALEGTLPPEADLFSGAFFGAGAELAGELPADSWLAIAQPEFGRTLSRVVDAFSAQIGGRQAAAQAVQRQTGLDLDRDILGWMGDVGIFARGTTRADVGGGLIVKSKDPATSKRTLERLGQIAARELRRPGGRTRVGAPTVPADAGFGVTGAGLPAPINVAQRGDRVVGAYGRRSAIAALEPQGRLADSADFKAAVADLGEGFAISTYLAVDQALQVARAFGASRSKDFADFERYAKRFRFIVGGTRKEGNSLITRTEVVLK